MRTAAQKIHLDIERFLTSRPFGAQSFNRLYIDTETKTFRHPGIVSKEWIPPAYVGWRAHAITLFLLGS
jgi:hypothetical protein